MKADSSRKPLHNGLSREILSVQTVLVVGPDGSGKSRVTEDIASQASRLGIPNVHIHHRPMIFAKRDHHAHSQKPHDQIPRGRIASAAKLLFVFADSVIGYSIIRKRMPKAGLLIVERGWFDMLVDPKRYRLNATVSHLVFTLGRLFPRADVAVLLTGDPQVIQARKNEISLEETQAQLASWSAVIPKTAREILEIDTTSTPPEEVSETVWASIARPAWARHKWKGVPLTPKRLSLSHSGRDVSSLRIYARQRLIARATAPLSASLVMLGLGPMREFPFDLAPFVEVSKVRPSSITTMRSTKQDRWIVGLSKGGRLTAVLKVGNLDDHGLRHEAALLSSWTPNGQLHVPKVLWHGELANRFGLITSAIHGKRRGPSVSLDVALVIANELVAGTGGRPLVHGDLTPWNIVSNKEKAFVVDWEFWRPERAPLFDLCHFVIRTGALLGRFDPGKAFFLLTSDGSIGWRHLEASGEAPERAPDFIRYYLETSETPGGTKVSRFERELWNKLIETSN